MKTEAMKTEIKTFSKAELPFVLALNEENVEVLSPMDEARAAYFAREADLFQVVCVDGKPAAFMIVMREGSDYDSENYRWFRRHYDQFLYVDRIVIDEPFRRAGLGRMLYRSLFAYAGDVGIDTVTAEVDIAPVYNAASLKFHAANGFEEVGQQEIRGGSIRVSLLAKSL